MPLRLVMMGTGQFALPTFLAFDESRHEVVGLYTQPDRIGRGHHHHRNPMKEAALERNIPVYQPEKANTPDSLKQLRQWNPDLCVVAAYGQILSRDLIEIAHLGAINVHASLLPKYRGAAPVHYAILEGETETGVTIFQIEPKLDAGLMLDAERISIGAKETAGELEQRLAELAAPLCVRVVDRLEAGTAEPVPQDPAQVTKAPRLKKSQGAIDWSQPAEKIACHIRAMQPWPAPFTFLHQEGRPPLRLIVLDVDPAAGQQLESLDTSFQSEPGQVLFADSKHLIVQTGDAPVEILCLRPAGKRAMSVQEFLCGHAVRPGDWLGPEQGVQRR